MKEYRIRPSVLASDSTVFVGLDVHKKSIALTVLHATGEVLWRTSCEPRGGHWVSLMSRLPGCQVHVALEAGPCGFWLARELRELGCEVVVAAPSKIPTASGDRVKTDKRDSLKLAQLLRGGLLQPISIPTVEEEHFRELTRTRKQVVEMRSDTYRRIKAKLLYHGIEIPEDFGRSTWGAPLLRWLENEAAAGTPLSVVLATLVRSVRDLTREIRALEAELSRWSTPATDKIIKHLCTAPGVGRVVATTFVAEVRNPARFPNGDAFASWLGVTPTEHSSGESTRRGHISRAGNKRLRAELVQAVWRGIRSDAGLRATYERIKLRAGGNRAVVAVARRLGIALWRMWLNECDWNPRQPAMP